jgi:hypothetical protein
MFQEQCELSLRAIDRALGLHSFYDPSGRVRTTWREARGFDPAGFNTLLVQLPPALPPPAKLESEPTSDPR